jgi:heat shock protein HslJ
LTSWPVQATEKTIEIAPERGFCQGLVPMLCLMVRQQPNGPFFNHYDGIEGFEYKPGYAYTLVISEEKRDPVPADASSLVWKLIEVKEKKPVSVPPDSYQGKDWRFLSIELPAGPELLPAEESVFLRFDADGGLSGSTGCNRCMGRYSVGEAGALSITGLAGTKKMCDAESMKTEVRVQAYLNGASRFSVAQGKLYLHDDKSGTRWVFEGAQ